MSQEAERVYTINLGKVWLSPNNQRAKRAINMIREFTEHHMKTGQVKIDQELSQVVWKRGIRSPPRKIRVKMAKTDDGYVMVSPYEEEKKVDAPKTEKKAEKPETKVEAKVETPKEEKKPKKEEKKAEEKKPKKEKVPSKKSVKKAAKKEAKKKSK